MTMESSFITDEIKEKFTELFPIDAIERVNITDNYTLLEILSNVRVDVKASDISKGYFVTCNPENGKWFYSIWSIHYPPKHGSTL